MDSASSRSKSRSYNAVNGSNRCTAVVGRENLNGFSGSLTAGPPAPTFSILQRIDIQMPAQVARRLKGVELRHPFGQEGL